MKEPGYLSIYLERERQRETDRQTDRGKDKNSDEIDYAIELSKNTNIEKISPKI